MTCPGRFNMELSNEASFPLSNCCYDHCKIVFYPFLAAVFRESYSFIKIMESISSNGNWENGVKPIRITEEKLSQSSILCQFLRTKTLDLRSKCIKHFCFYVYHYLPYICWVDVIYLTYLVFLNSLWWLVWIFCAPTPLT